ncbi:uncharacterized protein TM35_000201400 [Trypanosoma theileri]|uniref:Phosphoribulokinase/uridine kinase domain-containing protein n=1 Tax=Trypanosoma theileri TaxID=67003 RepID=A0A1X0NT00_9TRYP|nr:uncharacterized protein TM35_000201400 [Trypanosoma theileri]ORC87731.1 hypothetical protein TM35_000201400 [Trypanosoma theileri]
MSGHPPVVDAAELRRCATAIAAQYRRAPQHRLIIGVAGRPGSGKTTVARIIAAEVRSILKNSPNSMDAAVVVMPMDGYHLYRKVLHALPNSEEAVRRRGAEWTFDPRKLCHDLQAIRLPSAASVAAAAQQGDRHNDYDNNSNNRKTPFYDDVYVPSFDHGVGDPVERDICIPATANIIIVEGNYLLYRGTPAWAEVNRCFDITIFLACPAEICTRRLCRRHMAAWGISEAEAMKRAAGSDTTNGNLVDTTQPNADIVLHSVECPAVSKM